jgi:phosphatidyl-myo-inositol dimannoside synthase
MTEEGPQRILILTRNLPPLVGGMERLNWHMADELKRHADVRVVGPACSSPLAPKGVTVIEAPLRPLWVFLAMAIWHGLRQARNWKPDIVLAGSGLMALPAFLVARASGAQCGTYVHGLDVAVENPIYKALWWPALRRMDRVIANSRPTRRLAEKLGVKPERISIVHPGVELPATPSDEAEVLEFRASHGLGGASVLLSVGRLTERKGLREFVVEALPLIVKRHPGTVLLIVGDAPVDALHAKGQTLASIRAAAELVGVASALRFMGAITDYRELGLIYRAADVHVFPVRELPGDPEGFGMVAVEAAAHGLPTAAFATGGVIDAVEEGNSGRLVPQGTYIAFAQAVDDILATREQWSQSCRAFAEGFAWFSFGHALHKALLA